MKSAATYSHNLYMHNTNNKELKKYICKKTYRCHISIIICCCLDGTDFMLIEEVSHIHYSHNPKFIFTLF